MKVFFDTSLSSDPKLFGVVKKQISKEKAKLVYDWSQRKVLWKSDNKQIKAYKETLHHILASDICIFDISVPSMRIGHELTLALKSNKPTLVIGKNSLVDTEKIFIKGIPSHFLFLRGYDDFEKAALVVSNFIQNNSGVKIRFDISIPKELDDLLEEWSQKRANTKVEIIKELILNS